MFFDSHSGILLLAIYMRIFVIVLFLSGFSSETACVWEKIPVVAFRYLIHTHAYGKSLFISDKSIFYNVSIKTFFRGFRPGLT